MKRKKKILFLTETLNVGGAEKALVSLLRTLDCSQFDVTLKLISATGGLMEEIPYKDGLSVKKLIVPGRGRIKNLFNALRTKLLYRILPAGASGWFLGKGYDIVIAFCEGYLTKWIGSAWIRGKKIAWVHTDMIKNDWPLRTKVFKSAKAEKHAYLKFDQVIGVSKNVSEGVKKKFELSSVETVYNILDPHIITKASEPNTYNPISSLNIISVGRLEKVKGYDRLITAVGILVRDGYDISLCLVGDGTEKENLQRLVREVGVEDKIYFAGNQTNPYSFVRKADLYICTSLQEGFNIALLEAMTLGKPVVSVSCAGPDEILDGGKYGLLTENSISGITDALKKVYRDKNLLSYYSNMALDRAGDFTAKDQISKLENIFNLDFSDLI